MGQVTFDWLPVGNVGNAADNETIATKGPFTSPLGPQETPGDDTTGYGAVDYEFQIARTHVTTAQYVEFLNTVDPGGSNALNLYDSRMTTRLHPVSGLNLQAEAGGVNFDTSAADGTKYSSKSGQQNYPASWISWVSAARFVNWLSNGQGSGDTESGVYNNLPASAFDPVPAREPGSTIFLPSENEFYKAAYYDPTKDGTGGYWQYGTQSDTSPTSEAPSGGSNSANYAQTDGNPGIGGDIYWQSGQIYNGNLEGGYRTDVGAYTNSTSFYGLHDVDGASYQWLDTTRTNQFNASNELPLFRGGAWIFGSDGSGAAFRNTQFFAAGSSSLSSNYHGIRIAGLPVTATIDGDFDDNNAYEAADIDPLVFEIKQSSWNKNCCLMLLR